MLRSGEQLALKTFAKSCIYGVIHYPKMSELKSLKIIEITHQDYPKFLYHQQL